MTFVESDLFGEFERMAKRAWVGAYEKQETVERAFRMKYPYAVDYGRHTTGVVRMVWHMTHGREYVGRHRSDLKRGEPTGMTWVDTLGQAWRSTNQFGSREVITRRGPGGEPTNYN